MKRNLSTHKRNMRENKYKIAFFGTPEFAASILDELSDAGIAPALVVTAPDRPAGRGLVMTPPPVKTWALQHSISLLQPEKLDADFIAELGKEQWDLFIVAAYGKILKKEVLDLPAHGTLNVHPSLLPKYRGSSPIESVILSGDAETGVSIMLLDEYMDHGPVLAQKRVPLEETTTAPELEHALAVLGGALLADTIPGWINGNIESKPQDHDKATVTKKIKKEDGLISLSDDPITNYRKFRAYQGWPRTYFLADGKRIVITDATLENGVFVVKKVVPEGKKKMEYEDFLRG